MITDYDWNGVHRCWHCGGYMEKFGKTNSGRTVYSCPDCHRQQFLDGGHVPIDIYVSREAEPEKKVQP